jgi:hypothetical protein
LLQNLFRTAIARRGYKESDSYDWEKETNSIENEQNTAPPPPLAPLQQPTPQVLSSINNKISAYVFIDSF